MKKSKKDQTISALRSAIDAHTKGLSLFKKSDYTKLPKENEKDILAFCNDCSRFFKLLREDLDVLYTPVYETFRQGGIETDCRIGKNRWCFGLIEFAKSRLKDLEGN